MAYGDFHETRDDYCHALVAGLLTGRPDVSLHLGPPQGRLFVLMIPPCGAPLISRGPHDQTRYSDRRPHHWPAPHRALCRIVAQPFAISGDPRAVPAAGGYASPDRQ